MNPLFDKTYELTMTVLGYASKFGRVLGRFSGGRLSQILNKPADELLHSPLSMSVIVTWFTILPMLFILNAVIRHMKRRRVGLIYQDKQMTTGTVTAIEWKRLANGAYSKLTKDRYAKIQYKVNGSNWAFKAPAGGLLNGDTASVIYEKSKPSKVLLERDYREGWRGWWIEIPLAVAGIAEIIFIAAALIIVYTNI